MAKAQLDQHLTASSRVRVFMPQSLDVAVDICADIADYVHNYEIKSDLAFETARLCLIDTIGCGLEGLRFKECARLMGPVVEGTIVPNGSCTLQPPKSIYTVQFIYRDKGAGNELSARSHSRCIQHRDHDSLVGFQ